MNKLEQEIEDILLRNYDNPIGGDRSTHWYINVVARREIVKLFNRQIDKKKIKDIVMMNAVWWNKEWVVQPEELASEIAKELKRGIKC